MLNQYQMYERCVRTICSCNTLTQLNTAWKYIELYAKQTPCMSWFSLGRIHRKRQEEIYNVHRIPRG